MGSPSFVLLEKFFFYYKADNGCLFSPSSLFQDNQNKEARFYFFILGFLRWAFEGRLRGVMHSVQWVAVYPTLVTSFLILFLFMINGTTKKFSGKEKCRIYSGPLGTSDSIPDKSIKEFLWDTYSVIPAGILLRSKQDLTEMEAHYACCS